MIHGADPRVYEEVKIPDLQPVIEDYLAEYNSESKQPMQLVIFGDAMLHVVKIARVLRQVRASRRDILNSNFEVILSHYWACQF